MVQVALYLYYLIVLLRVHSFILGFLARGSGCRHFFPEEQIITKSILPTSTKELEVPQQILLHRVLKVDSLIKALDIKDG